MIEKLRNSISHPAYEINWILFIPSTYESSLLFHTQSYFQVHLLGCSI